MNEHSHARRALRASLALWFAAATAATAACASSGRPPRLPAIPADWTPAEGTALVIGTVSDSAGRAVEHAQVRVRGDSAAPYGTVSDARGGFVLRRVPLGERVLMVRRIGYRGDTAAVRGRAGGVDTVRFHLRPTPPHTTVHVVPDTLPSRRPKELWPAIGLHVGAPAKYALGAGLALVRKSSPESYDGYALISEIGLGGGKLSAGMYGFGMMGEGFQLRAAVVRSWRDPWKVAPNQTFVGPEVRFAPVALLWFGAGYYWRTAGDAPGDARFFAPTISFAY
jgi:hypothetical protein